MSATDRKPDARCPLNQLSPDHQAAVADYAATHSLAQTVLWLKDPARLAPTPAGASPDPQAPPDALPDPDQPPRLSVSRSALARWLAAFRARGQFAENRAAVAALLEELADRTADYDPAQLRQAGDTFFATMALCRQDHKLWARVQREILDRDRLELDIRKHEPREQSFLKAGMEAMDLAYQSCPQARDLYASAKAAFLESRSRAAAD